MEQRGEGEKEGKKEGERESERGKEKEEEGKEKGKEKDNAGKERKEGQRKERGFNTKINESKFNLLT